MSTLAQTCFFAAIIVVSTFPFLGRPTSPATVVTQASGKGEITGKVVDAQGRPIANVLVMAEVPGTPSATLPQTVTDRNGNFRIGNLSPELYILHTRKEDEGYPRSEFDFYHESRNDEATVRVYADRTAPSILIRLQQAAFLKGRVIDSSSGKPIEHL